MSNVLEQQLHGYRNGHQLLESTIKLSREDQDTVDRLSDMAGAPRPNELFDPYLTAYPLPGGTHYVVARTWQDLNAARAGCVVTRSLLIPIEVWMSLEGFGVLLMHEHLQSPASVDQDILDKQGWPPVRVQDARTVELVEALFLESRQPIVFFEATEAEPIALRVLAALWPSMRRNFSVCTFALAPRKIAGKDFDLVFSPRSAKSRFADWTGRRIDAGNSKLPRHRWSGATAIHIFQSDQPNLLARDELGLLKGDERGDEAALRLSLLWNELTERARSSPSAVLGLLDIAISQGVELSAAVERLGPAISQAVNLAVNDMAAEDAWKFLAALIQKFTLKFDTHLVQDAVQNATKRLVENAPQATIDFVNDDPQIARAFPNFVMAAIGDGLATNSNQSVSISGFWSIPADVESTLIALSPILAGEVISNVKLNPEQRLPKLLEMVGESDRDMRRSVRDVLIPLIDDGILAPVLPSLLDGISSQELSEVLIQVGNATNFKNVEFDEPLANAARDSASLAELRSVVATKFSNENSDRFLLSTLRMNVMDVGWVCGAEFQKSRKRNMLVKLFEQADDKSVLSVLRDSTSRDVILKTLLTAPKDGPEQIARVLALSDLPLEDLLNIGEQVLPLLIEMSAARLGVHLLERALSEADVGDERVLPLLTRIGSTMDARRLINMSVANSTPASRIGQNIVLLNSTTLELRQRIVACVDELSVRLVKRRTRDNLGVDAYRSWAELIASAGQVNHQGQVNAAMATFVYALGRREFPVSSLLVETFHIVHAQFLQSRNDDDFGGIPAFLALPLAFFADLDRAKAARRDLVDAFMRSSWPPADLLLSALRADADKAILKRVRRSYQGEKYLDAIERDCERLSSELRPHAINSLASFRKSRSRSDWD